MHAPRALLNAMTWFIGRHNQGFQFADRDLGVSLDNAVGGVLVGRGMTSVSLKPTRKESPLRRVPERVGLRHYATTRASPDRD